MLDLRVGGVHPDIMVLLPIVAGIAGGPARGATMGFGAGLVADLFLPTPFGLSALVGSLVGFGVGVATLALDRSALWLPPVAALGGSALYEVLYAVLGSVLGQPQMLHVDLLRIIVVVSVANAVLAIPALRLVTWALAGGVDRGSAHLGRLLGRVVGGSGDRVPGAGPTGLGYWCPVSRSLRHPFKGSRRFARPEQEREGPQTKSPKQPRMRQKTRFSVEAMLDAPDTSTSRPGLRLRIIGLVVLGLFGLLGLRLWALNVLQAPAAAQAVSANQIRAVPVAPTRGLILDRYGNPLVNNVVTEQITLSRVTAIQHPAVIGRLAALIGQTTAQVKATIADPQYSLYKPVPVLSNAPLSRHPLHQGAPERVPRGELGGHHPAQLPAAGDARAGPDGLPGRPGPRLRGHHQQHRAQVPGVPGLPGRRRLRPVRPRVPVRVRAAGHPGPTAAGGQPRGPGGGHPQDDAGQARRQPGHQHRHRPPAGGRQRPGRPDPGPPQDHRSASATTTPAAIRPPPVARPSSWTPRPAPSTPCPPTRPTTRRCGWEVSPPPTTRPCPIRPTTSR